MKVVLLLFLVGFVAASTIPKYGGVSSVQRVDIDDLKAEFDKFAEDMINELDEKKGLTYDMIKKIGVIIQKLRENHVDFVTLIKEKVKNIASPLKERIVDAIKTLENIFGIHESTTFFLALPSLHRVDIEELKKEFDKFADDMINELDEKKGLTYDMIKKIGTVIQKLREHHVDFVTLIRAKIENIPSPLKERITDAIKTLENIFGIQDSVQHIAFDDVEDVEEKKEELKEELKEAVDEVVDVVSGKQWPKIDIITRIGKLIRECVKFGLNIQDIVYQKLINVDQKFRDLFIKFIKIIYPKFEEEKSASVQRVDQDEITKDVIEKFNNVVDKIISSLKDNTFIKGDLLSEIINVINELRNRHVNVINLLNERIKTIKDDIGGHFVAFIKMLKKIFGLKDAVTFSEEFKPVEQHVDTDEVTSKVIERFNNIVDQIIEKLKDNRFFSPSLITQLVDAINVLRERHVNWLNLLNEKVKQIKEDVGGRVVSFINMIKKIFGISEAVAFSGEFRPVEQHIDTDEVTSKVIERFNSIVDQIIERLKQNRFFSPSLISQLVDAINVLRERHVNWFNLLNDKVKQIKEDVGGRVLSFINMIKKIFGIKEESVAFSEDLTKIQEEAKNRLEKIMDKVKEFFSGKGDLFGFGKIVNEFNAAMRDAFKHGLNIHDIITSKMFDINKNIRDAIEKFIERIFPDYREYPAHY